MCGQYASTRVCTQCCKLGNQPPNFNPSQFVHVVGPRKRAGNARTARGVTLNLSPPPTAATLGRVRWAQSSTNRKCCASSTPCLHCRVSNYFGRKLLHTLTASCRRTSHRPFGAIKTLAVFAPFSKPRSGREMNVDTIFSSCINCFFKIKERTFTSYFTLTVTAISA